ncbi:efflux transporter outer membrane subunit [Formicincola oecophyllae]|uniref:Efflux transporter outer membrane subunit n=1 Tax=Formicincola oecophyllae TaxID=2558361 RepID=A0A4Y6UCU7_9PROT|nr:efflux transporter outer membrane subunit [Formicincola oecophyllae]
MVKRHLHRLRHAATLVLIPLVVLGGCDMAPTYKGAPKLTFPDVWSDSTHGAVRWPRNMGKAIPADALPRGPWWTVFNDPLLNRMEEKLATSNPDLQAAAEAFLQSRDVARESEALLYPQSAGSAWASYNKGSLGRLYFSRRSHSLEYESNQGYQGAATWEPDFWDSIRNTTRMEKNQAQATAADYANARLSLQSELARQYILLRGLDAQDAVYRDSIRYFSAAVDITRMRQGGAIGAGLDVSRAEDQLYSAQGALSHLKAQRAVTEHAIAVLLNTTPAAFHIKPMPGFTIRIKEVPIEPGLPSTLLERRPDIAASERQLAGAVASIGVARAAFYPHITLSASGGFQNGGFDLAQMAMAMWRVAIQAAERVYTGGLRRAALQRSWSSYRQSFDEYRATVLEAFKEVEDNLSRTKLYARERRQLHRAVEAALRTQSMTMALYTGGLSNYLDALVAQQDALKARLNEVSAQTEQLQSTVSLIRALGGGWRASDMPTIAQIDPVGPLQYEGLHYALSVGGVPNGVHFKGLAPPKVDSNLASPLPVQAPLPSSSAAQGSEKSGNDEGGSRLPADGPVRWW